MNSAEILGLLRSDPYTNYVFLGVYAINELPKISVKPCALVINLDPNTHPGSHWVCAYFYKQTCDYFDSYGLKPILLLKRYMLKYSDTILFSTKQLQSPFSSTCGQMCIYFLVWRARNVPLLKIISSLDVSYADEFITLFVNKLFKINTVMIDENFLMKQLSDSYINR